MATSAGDDGRLRRGRRPGHRARHLPRREHDPHRPGRVRPLEHAVRRALPAAGGHRDRRSAARGGPRRAASGRSASTSSGSAPACVSMALLLVSSFVTDDEALAYPLLLLATASLGAGFGLTVPALNTFTAAFHPDAVDRSILVLNALLGLGTVLAPVFVAIFDGLGFWWGLPLASAILLVVLVLVEPAPAAARSAPQPPTARAAARRSRAGSGPTRASRSSTASARRSTATGRSST